MDENEFWALIDRSRDGSGPQEEALEELLTGRAREELEEFDRIYQEKLAQLHSWDVWGAGYVINRGMSDDSFADFCDWLISRGRSVFETAIADPDALADVPDAVEGAIEAEGLRAAVWEAYETTYDEEMPSDGGPGDEPSGNEWDDDDLAERFPRLTAKFG
jgi:Protein of unknown function (DUF4240)